MNTPRPRILVIGAVLLLAGAGAAYATLGNAAPAIDPAKLVKAERGTMRRSVVATGKVEPVTRIEVKAKANGIIERLQVDVDQLVEPGAVLAELDKENLTARLREARATLQAAEASYQAVSAQLEKNQVEAEAPDVAFAARNHRRATQLFDQKLVSQSALDEAAGALEGAQNRQRAAQGQLAVSRARQAEAKAVVEQARAAVERAEEELANATLRAPIRGTVLTRDVEVGSPVSSILNLGANATLVMTIGDIEHVFVRGRVDESDIGRVRVGMPARITTESFPDRTFEGKVTRISPIGVEKENVTTFEVKVSIDNPDRILRANMTANAEIVLEELTGSLLIPESAVSWDEQRKPFVETPDATAKSGRRRQSVALGAGNGTRIQVLDGLREGQAVILPQ